jgi:hypothetical protein
MYLEIGRSLSQQLGPPYAIKQAFAMEIRNESRAQNERLHYMRTGSPTNRKLDEVPLLGRVRKFSLAVFR